MRCREDAGSVFAFATRAMTGIINVNNGPLFVWIMGNPGRSAAIRLLITAASEQSPMICSLSCPVGLAKLVTFGASYP
jgi:hypothetical protein